MFSCVVVKKLSPSSPLFLCCICVFDDFLEERGVRVSDY